MTEHDNAPAAAGSGIDVVGFEGHHAAADGSGEFSPREVWMIASAPSRVKLTDWSRQGALGEGNAPDGDSPQQAQPFSPVKDVHR